MLNYELAVELCGYEGIQAKAVFVKDDILHADRDNRERRRGAAGIMCVIKTAQGAAEEGLDLKETERLAKKAGDHLGTVSVTFWPGYRPETGVPMYEMKHGMIEFGMGFNGEPGILKMQMPDSDTLCTLMMDYLVEDLEIKKQEEILVIVNGKGATSNMELYVLCSSIQRYLDRKEICLFKMETGNYFTAPGMGGVSVTIMKMDQELKRYYGRESYTPMYTYR